MHRHAIFYALIAVILLILAGCGARPARPVVVKAAARASVSLAQYRPPTTPGMPLSGFWQTWGEPLRERLHEHRAEAGRRCRHSLSLLIEKHARHLTLLCDGKPVKGYFVSLGATPNGAKERRSDARTPEGHYYIYAKNPGSRFHVAFRVAYPNAQDAARGLHDGLINQATYQRIVRAARTGGAPPQNTRLGGDICIHGGGLGEQFADAGGQRFVSVMDWTKGCIGMRNQDIDELWAVLGPGTPVTIRP